jgi:hypothetical protein
VLCISTLGFSYRFKDNVGWCGRSLDPGDEPENMQYSDSDQESRSMTESWLSRTGTNMEDEFRGVNEGSTERDYQEETIREDLNALEARDLITLIRQSSTG